MLTKPLTHLRPLLRLPSHSSPTPDHFSSNPSLLHHLPQHPTTSLVSATQTSAQAASGSANAGASGAGSGRAGWGAGAGSNAGYTGHARAFLSLQHTTSVDPTSGLNHNNDDNQRQKNYLLFKHQLSKRTQLIDTDDGSRAVHRQIEAQAGQRLKAVDLDSRPELKKLEAPTPSTRRRSSIAFPSPPPRFASPQVTRASTPTALRAIPRSQSTLEIWHVGMAPPRQLSMRAMSTRSSNISLPEVEEETQLVRREPTQSARIIGQPNRVLMDLAGLDLPGRPASIPMVRRNSTAAMRQSDAVPDLGAPVEDSDVAGYTQQGEGQANDHPFYYTLRQARWDRDERLSRKLIKHYRSNRDPSAFAPQTQDAELDQYPLPEGYSTSEYNECLESLLDFRRDGESIAPVLEVYNEMLDRDCVPDGRTYSIVIEALCAREEDVWTAVRSWEYEKRWDQWKAERLNEQYDVSGEAAKDQVVEGYKAEGNFDSAIRLFHAATISQSATARLRSNAYTALLNAAAKRDLSQEDLTEAYNVLKHGVSMRIRANRPWRGILFQILAKVNDVESLNAEIDRFVDAESKGEHQGPILFMERWGQRDPEPEVVRLRAKIWLDAITSLLQVGQVEKAQELWTQLCQGKNGAPGVVDGSQRVAYGLALARVDLELGLAELRKTTDIYSGHSIPRSAARDYVDFLIEYDQSALLQTFLVSRLGKALETITNDLSFKQYERLLTYLVNIASRDKTSIAPLKTYQQLSNIRQIPLNPAMLAQYIQVSINHNDKEQMFHAWNAFAVSRNQAEATATNKAEQVRRIIHDTVQRPDVPVTVLLTLLRRASDHVDLSKDEVLSVSLARRYMETPAREESLQWSQHRWEILITTILNYPHDDGEMDEALLQIVTDLTNIAKDQAVVPEHVQRILNASYTRQCTARLAQRVGRDRAVELLTPLLGEAKASSWAVVEGQSSLPGPAAVEHAAPIPETPSSGFIISPRVSTSIDRHTYRHHSITAQEAYQVLKQAMHRDRMVAHPDQIARLIDNLARIPDEAKTRELYALAHHIIATSLPEAERMAAWYNLENCMLIAACHLGHLEEAGMYRARLIEAGMAPSADAYATMIACSKDTTDDALVARELFEEAKSMQVVPNLFLFNTIISKLSKARKAEMALDLFKTMKVMGVRPSSVTYGAVINACCRVGDGESAAVLFNEMSSQRDFKPRVPPFNTMMQFHLTTQPSRERVLHYYNLLTEKNVAPSAHTYKLLLDAWAVLPPTNLAAMNKVFDALRNDRHVQVQGTHWASIISAYGIYGDNMEQALAIFHSIPSDRRHGVDLRQEPVVWEAILNVVAQKGTVEDMDNIHQQMLSVGAKATAYVYNVLIAGYARAGLIERAREVFASMGDSITGVAAPNNHPQLLTSSGHVKPSTVTSAPTGVVYREPSTYESMIRSELSMGNKEAAEAVLALMQERRYPVAVFMKAKSLLDDYAVHAAAQSSMSVSASEADQSSESPQTPSASPAFDIPASATFEPRPLEDGVERKGVYSGSEAAVPESPPKE